MRKCFQAFILENGCFSTALRAKIRSLVREFQIYYTRSIFKNKKEAKNFIFNSRYKLHIFFKLVVVQKINKTFLILFKLYNNNILGELQMYDQKMAIYN